MKDTSKSTEILVPAGTGGYKAVAHLYENFRHAPPSQPTLPYFNADFRNFWINNRSVPPLGLAPPPHQEILDPPMQKVRAWYSY